MPTILIVEDERILALDLSRALEKLGYQVSVICAVSGEGAIQSAELLHPDLVCMDIVLEGPVNGIQAARQIWDKHRIPSVFVTAQTDQSTLQEAEEVTGMVGLVRKPYSEDELKVAIEKALSRVRPA
jgi:CheY-like chemotaxis protein